MHMYPRLKGTHYSSSIDAAVEITGLFVIDANGDNLHSRTRR